MKHPLADSCVGLDDPEFSVQVSTLDRDMQPRTVLRHKRMAPYQWRPPRFENLCGQFDSRVVAECMVGAIVQSHSCFGWQKALYHTEGCVSLSGHTANFKGVRNHESLSRLARAMCLAGPENRVHMAVLSGATGVAADVYQEGFLEISLWSSVRSGHVKVDVPFEQTNSLRLSVLRFEDPGTGGDFELEARFRPSGNDWTVTTRGSVVARMTWDGGLAWDAETEAALGALAERVIAFLGRMCS